MNVNLGVDEEFLIVLPNTDEKAAINIINEQCEIFSMIRHNNDENEFNVTFSTGVATYPKRQTPASLSEAADRALYAAKHQGRNRVLLAK